VKVFGNKYKEKKILALGHIVRVYKVENNDNKKEYILIFNKILFYFLKLTLIHYNCRLFALKRFRIGHLNITNHDKFLDKSANPCVIKVLLDLKNNSNYSEFVIKYVDCFFQKNSNDFFYLVLEYCEVSKLINSKYFLLITYFN
jgi:serine/threonine protein kinase